MKAQISIMNLWANKAIKYTTPKFLYEFWPNVCMQCSLFDKWEVCKILWLKNYERAPRKRVILSLGKNKFFSHFYKTAALAAYKKVFFFKPDSDHSIEANNELRFLHCLIRQLYPNKWKTCNMQRYLISSKSIIFYLICQNYLNWGFQSCWVKVFYRPQIFWGFHFV